MKTVANYQIIRRATVGDLAASVKAALADGWQPWEQPFNYDDYVCQAVVLYEEDLV